LSKWNPGGAVDLRRTRHVGRLTLFAARHRRIRGGRAHDRRIRVSHGADRSSCCSRRSMRTRFVRRVAVASAEAERRWAAGGATPHGSG
jgi:hypothetical protein